MGEVTELADVENALADVAPGDKEVELFVEEPPDDDYSPVKFDLERQKKFLTEFAKTGNVSTSAKRSGISRKVVYQAKEKSPRFKEMFEEARQIAFDLLEEEARNYATDGKVTWEKYDENGNLVEQRVDYSEKLLMRLLEANRPEKFDNSGDGELPNEITVKVEPQSEAGHEKEKLDDGS